MASQKTLRLLLATIGGQLVTILYIGLSKTSRLTTLRLFYDYFIGEATTISYDYSSRNAATIADLYWLSGESPKREAAVPPVVPRCPPLDCSAGWRVPDRPP